MSCLVLGALFLCLAVRGVNLHDVWHALGAANPWLVFGVAVNNVAPGRIGDARRGVWLARDERTPTGSVVGPASSVHSEGSES